MECKAALLKQPYLKAESDLGLFTTWIAVQDLDAVPSIRRHSLPPCPRRSRQPRAATTPAWSA